MLTAQEVFQTTVKVLPPDERLRLAALILDDLTRRTTDSIDESDVWTDEDITNFTNYALRSAAAANSDEDDLV